MRFRRIEFIALALTLACVCFMGGYFTGSKTSINIVAVEPQNGNIQLFEAEQPHSIESVTAQSDTVRESSYPTVLQETPHQDLPSSGNEEADLPAGAPRNGDGKININTASAAELTDLPGIGAVLAGRIVDYRTQYGAFARIEDITRVSGIGEKRFEAIMNMITVG